MSEKSMKVKMLEKLNEWKGSAEYLNLQMHLGSAEAKDEFENQKKNLNNWITLTAAKLDDAKGFTDKEVTKIKAALDELRLQIALGKAETEDVIKEQQAKISKAVSKFKQTMADVYKTSEAGVKDFAKESSETIDDLHTRFDLFRLQMHLGKKEAEKLWEEKKKVLSRELDEFKQKADKVADVASDKLEEVSEEISNAWKHLKSVFKG